MGVYADEACGSNCPNSSERYGTIGLWDFRSILPSGTFATWHLGKAPGVRTTRRMAHVRDEYPSAVTLKNYAPCRNRLSHDPGID